jgi:hypothetical protein
VALELFKKASDDIGHLLDGVHQFTSWWRQAQILISTLATQMFVNDQQIHPFRLEMGRKGWESVRDQYEVYIISVSALQTTSSIV